MSDPVPRGTNTSIWPRLLAEHEAEQAGDAPPMGEVIDLHRRRVAAGYAHISRLAVDGGPVTEPKPIRRRLALNLVGVIGILICALGAVVALYGVMG